MTKGLGKVVFYVRTFDTEGYRRLYIEEDVGRDHFISDKGKVMFDYDGGYGVQGEDIYEVLDASKLANLKGISLRKHMK